MGIVRRNPFLVPDNSRNNTPPKRSPPDEPEQPYSGLVLTAEEIKDIVCGTGLWLAVREGFGGLGVES